MIGKAKGKEPQWKTWAAVVYFSKNNIRSLSSPSEPARQNLKSCIGLVCWVRFSYLVSLKCLNKLFSQLCGFLLNHIGIMAKPNILYEVSDDTGNANKIIQNSFFNKEYLRRADIRLLKPTFLRWYISFSNSNWISVQLNSFISLLFCFCLWASRYS